MSASVRLVVQMSPAEKAALARKAGSAGLTASEFARRRISEEEASDPRGEAELEAILAAIETAAPRILRSLDSTIAITEKMTAELEALRNQRAVL